jgi:lipoate-protein ligase B
MPYRIAHMSKDTWLLDLPQTEYSDALKLQHRCVAARQSGRLHRDLIIMLEHPPVFTLGRRGGLDNLLISETQLKQKGIPIVPIERGGNITYHGPGQLVVYLIIDLNASRLGVTDLVSNLESAMVRVASDWDITAQGNKEHRGAWVGNRKLGSIGITVRRGISFHGLALNVTTDLAPFEWINPCGIQGCAMTSIIKETRQPVEMEAIRQQMQQHLGDVMDRPLYNVERVEVLTRTATL